MATKAATTLHLTFSGRGVASLILNLTGNFRFPPLYYGRLSKGKKLKRYRGVRVWHLNAADEGSSNRLCGQFGTESATSAIQQRRQEQGDLQGGHVILVIRRQMVHF